MSRRKIAAFTAAASLGLVVTAAPASAHTALRSSDPAAKSTVEAPKEIVLTYTQAISLPKVILTDKAGAQFGDGAPKAVDNKVTLPVKPGLANGEYTVGWRVVSLDGHPVSGSFRFTVKGSTVAPPTGSASASAAPPASAAPETTAQKTAPEESGSGGWLWIGLGAVLVAAVAGGVALLRRSKQS